MENRNINLQTQLQRNVKERKEADEKTMELLDILDEVRPCYTSVIFLPFFGLSLVGISSIALT